VIADDPCAIALTGPGREELECDYDAYVEMDRARVSARCQDLLSVELSSGRAEQEQPCHHIEFLHRTVRDFLDEAHIAQMLAVWAGKCFNATTTLIAAYVFLVKLSLPDTKVMRSTYTQTLERAREALVLASRVDTEAFTRILTHLDRAMRSMSDTLLLQEHWIYATGLAGDGNDGDDMISRLIQCGCVLSVRALLQRDRDQVTQKQGRPYLDYALRTKLRYPEIPGEAMRLNRLSTDSRYGLGDKLLDRRKQMVEMLIALGCDVNEQYHEESNRTLWELYLVSDQLGHDVVWTLIRGGAQDVGRYQAYIDAGIHKKGLTARELFAREFSSAEAKEMSKALARNGPWSLRTWVRRIT